MDSIRAYNERRWNALVEARAVFTRPALDLTETTARALIDPHGLLGIVRGRSVLCLASGGGKQSAAFGVLGAQVTVADICEPQLATDRSVAAIYGYSIQTVEADMRDLSALGDAVFDLVHHAYSINFIPDPSVVFSQIGRVLKPGGTYIAFANPFAQGVSPSDWRGDGYPLRSPYEDGLEIEYRDEPWVLGSSSTDRASALPPPREYRHTLSRIINSLTEMGFIPRYLSEHRGESEDDSPGTWVRFTSILPPWFDLWTWYRPDLAMQPNRQR